MNKKYLKYHRKYALIEEWQFNQVQGKLFYKIPLPRFQGLWSMGFLLLLFFFQLDKNNNKKTTREKKHTHKKHPYNFNQFLEEPKDKNQKFS